MLEAIVIGSVGTLVLLAVGVEVLSRLAKEPPRYLVWGLMWGQVTRQRIRGYPSRGVSRRLFRAWWWFHARHTERVGVTAEFEVTTSSSNFAATDMGSPWDNSTETMDSKPARA